MECAENRLLAMSLPHEEVHKLGTLLSVLGNSCYFIKYVLFEEYVCFEFICLVLTVLFVQEGTMLYHLP